MIKADFIEEFKKLGDKSYGHFVGAAPQWLGGKITNISEENVSIAFTIRKEMLNPTGATHGGMISLIMDEVMGLRVFLMGRPESFVAINITVDFLRRSGEGDVLTAHPVIVRSGKKMVNTSCTLINQDGKLIATATSNFTKIS